MKVFVSHSNKDISELHKLKKEMLSYGIYLFLAGKDVKTGERYLEKIKKEISECDIFLIIGNKNSKNSEYCDQEIGMAIAHKKDIISTFHADSSPWGFTKGQQAIRYRSILEDLRSELLQHITQLKKYRNHWESELKNLEILKIKGFSVDKLKTDYINLKIDMWNDYGYYTAFTILRKGKMIGNVKIGYKNQTPSTQNENIPQTKDELPQNFYFLGNGFFSYVNLEILPENNLLSKEEKQALYQLLNDVRYKKHLAKQYINEDVLKTSLFRDRGKELEKLKNSLKKETNNV